MVHLHTKYVPPSACEGVWLDSGCGFSLCVFVYVCFCFCVCTYVCLCVCMSVHPTPTNRQKPSHTHPPSSLTAASLPTASISRNIKYPSFPRFSPPARGLPRAIYR